MKKEERIEKSMAENLKKNRNRYDEFLSKLSGGIGIDDTSDEVTATIMILSDSDFVDGELPDEGTDFNFLWHEPTAFMQKFVIKAVYKLADIEEDEKIFWGDMAIKKEKQNALKELCKNEIGNI